MFNRDDVYRSCLFLRKRTSHQATVQHMYMIRTTNARCNERHCATLLFTVIMLFLTVVLMMVHFEAETCTLDTQHAICRFLLPRYSKACLTFNPKYRVHVSCQTVGCLIVAGSRTAGPRNCDLCCSYREAQVRFAQTHAQSLCAHLP